MRIRVGIDTNILVYAERLRITSGDRHKPDTVWRLLGRRNEIEFVIPAQVLGELFRVLTRSTRMTGRQRLAKINQWWDAHTVIGSDESDFRGGMMLAAEYGLGIWDAVILHVAATAECTYFLSEDMTHGFKWLGTTVINPFASELPRELI